MKIRTALLAALLFAAAATGRASSETPPIRQPKLRAIVDATILPLMARYKIPGMEVAIIVNGQTVIYNYGVASKATGARVNLDTLFEIGSISKTFTATLAACAQSTHHLSLADNANKYIPGLDGSAFSHVTLINLATHTTGGLPLQLPQTVTTSRDLLRYYQTFKPTCAPGTCRTYGNPGIALLGLATAASMRQDFTTLMQDQLLAPLVLHHTYLEIPNAQQPNYAQGYGTDDAPIRMGPSVIAAETYGILTTATDLARILQANMDLLPLNPTLRAAIMSTHTGYYRIGPMTQDLVWEQYGYPAALKALLRGNSPAIILQPAQTTAINPPAPPDPNTLINKTGSTDGFSAYVLFVPRARSGVVLLANKAYPIEARVESGWAILQNLRGLGQQGVSSSFLQKRTAYSLQCRKAPQPRVRPPARTTTASIKRCNRVASLTIARRHRLP